MIDLSNPEAVIAEMRRRSERRAKGMSLLETAEEIAEVLAAKENDSHLEKEIQADCVKRYRANGCIVYEGLREKRKTKIQPGWPDLGVFHPATRSFWFHEVKTPKGKLRPDQADFRETCLATGVRHFVGGVDTAERALDEFVRRVTITPMEKA